MVLSEISRQQYAKFATANGYAFVFQSVRGRYDSDGNREDIAADFNTSLDSSVFADLQLVEQGYLRADPQQEILQRLDRVESALSALRQNRTEEV